MSPTQIATLQASGCDSFLLCPLPASLFSLDQVVIARCVISEIWHSAGPGKHRQAFLATSTMLVMCAGIGSSCTCKWGGSFSPDNSPVGEPGQAFVFPFCRWANWGSETKSVTRVVSGRAKTRMPSWISVQSYLSCRRISELWDLDLHSGSVLSYWASPSASLGSQVLSVKQNWEHTLQVDAVWPHQRHRQSPGQWLVNGCCLTNASSSSLLHILNADTSHIQKLSQQVTFTVRILNPFWDFPNKLFTHRDDKFERENDDFEFILGIVQSLGELRDIQDNSEIPGAIAARAPPACGHPWCCPCFGAPSWCSSCCPLTSAWSHPSLGQLCSGVHWGVYRPGWPVGESAQQAGFLVGSRETLLFLSRRQSFSPCLSGQQILHTAALTLG